MKYYNLFDKEWVNKKINIGYNYRKNIKNKNI